MTGKRRAFVEHYLGTAHFNATQAAKLAGYQDPRNEGWRLLQQPEIKAAVSEHLDAAAMAANEVLARLADHARGTLEDFLDSAGSIDLGQAREAGKLHLIRELLIEEERRGGEDGTVVRKVRVKLYDAQAALVQLGRHHGLFTDKVAVEQRGPIHLTWEVEYVNDWRKEHAGEGEG